MLFKQNPSKLLVNLIDFQRQLNSVYCILQFLIRLPILDTVLKEGLDPVELNVPHDLVDTGLVY